MLKFSATDSPSILYRQQARHLSRYIRSLLAYNADAPLKSSRALDTLERSFLTIRTAAFASFEVMDKAESFKDTDHASSTSIALVKEMVGIKNSFIALAANNNKIPDVDQAYVRLVFLYAIQNRYQRIVNSEETIAADFNKLIQCMRHSKAINTELLQLTMHHLIAEIDECTDAQHRMEEENPPKELDAFSAPSPLEYVNLRNALVHYQNTQLKRAYGG